MRTDAVHRVILNCPIIRGMKVTIGHQTALVINSFDEKGKNQVNAIKVC